MPTCTNEHDWEPRTKKTDVCSGCGAICHKHCGHIEHPDEELGRLAECPYCWAEQLLAEVDDRSDRFPEALDVADRLLEGAATRSPEPEAAPEA